MDGHREKFAKFILPESSGGLDAFRNSTPKGRLQTPSSDGEGSWIEARPANQMSQAEKDRNAERARAERKFAKAPLSHQSSGSRIPLKRKPSSNDSDPESSDDVPKSAQKVNLAEILKRKKSKLVNDSLMSKDLEDVIEYDPLAEKREKEQAQKIRIREERIANRQQTSSLSRESTGEAVVNVSRNRKRILVESDDEEEAQFPITTTAPNPILFQSPAVLDDLILVDTPQVQQRKKLKATKKVKKEEIDLVSDNDEDEDNGHDYTEREYTERDLQEKALQVVKQCERVGANLRRCLKEWENSSSSSKTTANDTALDCVNLVNINQSQSYSSGNILSNEDIAVICPTLSLNPYQLVGVNWLKLLYENNINGVLADDMGLGKTVQTIAFLGWLFLQNDDSDPNKQPTLIVVPASTLANWENELARFCPALSVVRFHGSQAEKEELRYDLRKQIAKGKVDVILTTYTLFERESGKIDRAFLLKQDFNYLILDEAHSIKNASSSRYAHLNQLQTQHRLLLSGTPVQNDLSELLALLSFLMPEVFGREDCEAMMAAFSLTSSFSSSSSSSSSSKSIGGVTLAQVKSMLAPFVLRRLKRDVLDHLSDKKVQLCQLPMETSQKQIYNDIILAYADRKRRAQLKFQASSDEARILEGKIKGGKTAAAATGNGRGRKKKQQPEAVIEIEEDHGEGIVDLVSPSAAATSAANETVKVTEIIHLDELSSTSTSSAAVLKTPETEQLSHNLRELTGNEAKHLFTALRKAANHPLLLRVHYQDDKLLTRICQVAYHEGYFGFQVSMERAKSEIEGFSDFDIHQLCLQFKPLHALALDGSVLYASPKMKYLQELLPRLQELGHRMLLFSQWTRLLDLLEVLLNDMNMPFLRLDGSTPIKERQELIDTFNEDYAIPVFLLSTKAGGLGINLTAADTVILHDLDFNPENDKQAEDRCHRIGQTKPVTVYKLVTVDTVDEDIFDMGERKRQLSEAVLSDARSPAAKGAAVASGKAVGSKQNKDDDELTVISRILSKALKRQGIQL